MILTNLPVLVMQRWIRSNAYGLVPPLQESNCSTIILPHAVSMMIVQQRSLAFTSTRMWRISVWRWQDLLWLDLFQQPLCHEKQYLSFWKEVTKANLCTPDGMTFSSTFRTGWVSEGGTFEEIRCLHHALPFELRQAFLEHIKEMCWLMLLSSIHITECPFLLL